MKKTLEGEIVGASGPAPSRLTIDTESGEVLSIEPARGGADVNLPGLVFPGFLDLHVHAREFPLPEDADASLRALWDRQVAKEDFATAGRAAIAGGVCGFAEMPNNPLPPSDAAFYEKKRELTARAGVDVLLIAAIHAGSEPFADVPYKLMMDRCGGGIAFDDLGEVESTLARYSGHFVIFHCEAPAILRGERRPPEAEVEAVGRVLEWSVKYDISTHIAHISTRRAVEMINEFNRSSSNRVTCEVTPHHLAFCSEHTVLTSPPTPLKKLKRGSFLFMNPPLRTEEDRRFLVEALRDGQIDMIATDHAPHTIADKGRGAPGVAHLDTLAPFACWLMKERAFSPQRVAAILAEEPGRVFSRFLKRRMGRLAPGYRANLTVIDAEAELPITASTLETRCGWSPFEGLSLPGRAIQCWVGGRRIRNA